MKLTLVGLPLGRIEDISYLAVSTLAKANLVICEDTRVFYKLWQKLMNLNYLENKYEGRLMVINEFNEKSKVDQLVAEIAMADEAVLVSDAGMPTVSDPGYRLVCGVIDAGGSVTAVPGPTAIMTALSISGLSADRLMFLGFLPKKQSKRSRLVDSIGNFEFGLTVGLYEAPQRIAKTLTELKEAWGSKIAEVVIARELTKEHEEVFRGPIDEAISFKVKGEVVLLVRLSADD